MIQKLPVMAMRAIPLTKRRSQHSVSVPTSSWYVFLLFCNFNFFSLLRDHANNSYFSRNLTCLFPSPHTHVLHCCFQPLLHSSRNSETPPRPSPVSRSSLLSMHCHSCSPISICVTLSPPSVTTSNQITSSPLLLLHPPSPTLSPDVEFIIYTTVLQI